MTAQNKFLTVRELAAHWKWAVEDVYNRLDEGSLWTTPKLAARKDKRDVRVVAVTLLDERTIPDLEAKYPNDYIEIVTPEPWEADSEAESWMWGLLDDYGDLERVITMAEIERVEREHPDWFSKPAIPEEESLPVVPRAAPNHKLLTTPEMADAFHGIDGWTMEQWKNNLPRAKWAEDAKTDGGGRPKPDLWDPVKLANCLLTRKESPKPLVQAINKAFQTHRHLSEWRDEWAPYAEQYAD